MRTATALLAALSMAWAATPDDTAAAESLGRLFFTPEQRAWQEHQRLNESGAAALAGATLTLNGIVAAANAQATVWINGSARRGDSPGLRTEVSRQTPSRIELTLATGSALTLRVGETIDVGTHRSSTALSGHAIQIHRPTPAR